MTFFIFTDITSDFTTSYIIYSFMYDCKFSFIHIKTHNEFIIAFFSYSKHSYLILNIYFINKIINFSKTAISSPKTNSFKKLLLIFSKDFLCFCKKSTEVFMTVFKDIVITLEISIIIK